MKTITVEHSDGEYRCAKYKGELSHNIATQKKYYADRVVHSEWVYGFIGEDVVCKYYNLYPYRDNANRLDIGQLQVRSTTHHGNCLLLRKQDERYKDKIYIFVVLDLNDNVCSKFHTLAGWTYAKDVMIDKYWTLMGRHFDVQSKKDWLWKVPQSALHPMDEILIQKDFLDTMNSRMQSLFRENKQKTMDILLGGVNNGKSL